MPEKKITEKTATPRKASAKPAAKAKATAPAKPKPAPKRTRAKPSAKRSTAKAKATTTKKPARKRTPAVKIPRKHLVPMNARPVMRTPEALREGIQSYFDWCAENPWPKVVGIDKEGNPVVVPKTRPFLVEGMVNHIGISRRHWNAIQTPDNPSYREDLMDVIEWATNILFSQKVTGAVVDDYKENIVARLTGLADKKTLAGDEANPLHVQIKNEEKGVGDEVVRTLLGE